jgi:hypothetical protein
VVRGFALQTPVSVIVQANQGRFAARRNGLAAARGTFCLLLDGRIVLELRALEFVFGQLREYQRDVWNGHVVIEAGGNAFALFWDMLAKRAFAAYFSNPTTTSFGLQDFDRYPKGTGCFFSPRRLLESAFEAFRPRYEDIRQANDDAPLLRWIAARRPINISPSFSCIYEARGSLRPFFRHAMHRGVVFLDGHGRRESRWLPVVLAFFPISVAWVAVAALSPWLLLMPIPLFAICGAALGWRTFGLQGALPMAAVTPIYALGHAVGMWRGAYLLVRARLRGAS